MGAQEAGPRDRTAIRASRHLDQPRVAEIDRPIDHDDAIPGVVGDDRGVGDPGLHLYSHRLPALEVEEKKVGVGAARRGLERRRSGQHREPAMPLAQLEEEHRGVDLGEHARVERASGRGTLGLLIVIEAPLTRLLERDGETAQEQLHPPHLDAGLALLREDMAPALRHREGELAEHEHPRPVEVVGTRVFGMRSRTSWSSRPGPRRTTRSIAPRSAPKSVGVGAAQEVVDEPAVLALESLEDGEVVGSVAGAERGRVVARVRADELLERKRRMRCRGGHAYMLRAQSVRARTTASARRRPRSVRTIRPRSACAGSTRPSAMRPATRSLPCGLARAIGIPSASRERKSTSSSARAEASGRSRPPQARVRHRCAGRRPPDASHSTSADPRHGCARRGRRPTSPFPANRRGCGASGAPRPAPSWRPRTRSSQRRRAHDRPPRTGRRGDRRRRGELPSTDAPLELRSRFDDERIRGDVVGFERESGVERAPPVVRRLARCSVDEVETDVEPGSARRRDRCRHPSRVVRAVERREHVGHRRLHPDREPVTPARGELVRDRAGDRVGIGLDRDSAPATRPKPSRTAWSIRARSPGGSSVGVPPPKNTVAAGRAAPRTIEYGAGEIDLADGAGGVGVLAHPRSSVAV